MFRQVYESEPLPYMTAAQLGTDSYAGILSYATYKLKTNPTLYAEELRTIKGICVVRDRIATSDTVIRVIAETNTIVAPGPRNYSFDGTSGKSLNDPVTNRTTIPFLDGISIVDVITDADGGAWGTTFFSYGMSWWPMNPRTQVLDRSAGTRVDASTYGKTSLNVFTIDKKHNLLLAKDTESSYIELFNFTTGKLLDILYTSGIPEQIIPEDAGRAFVYCKNNMLNLIDYVNRRILSTFKAPLPRFVSSDGYQDGSQHYAYDRFFRRLLSIQKLPNDPIDGSCTSRVKGWYPVPLPVRLTKPIPLLPPREGRNVPCLTRLIGDAGEPVGGVHVQGVMNGVTASVSPGVSDNNGYAILHTKATASGVATLTTTAEVVTV